MDAPLIAQTQQHDKVLPMPDRIGTFQLESQWRSLEEGADSSIVRLWPLKGVDREPMEKVHFFWLRFNGLDELQLGTIVGRHQGAILAHGRLPSYN